MTKFHIEICDNLLKVASLAWKSSLVKQENSTNEVSHSITKGMCQPASLAPISMMDPDTV